VITLAENEERLVETLRTLPPIVADHVMTWISGLSDLGNGKSLDWSDAWTEDDLKDARNASLAELDEQDRSNA
jgi:hypothetical protein